MLYRRVLITGANGLLGQALVAHFSTFPDYDLLATGRDEKPKFTHQTGGYIPLDVTQPDDVRQVFMDFSPDVVLHTAAMTHVDQCETDKELCWQANVSAVETIVRNCRATGARLVHLSTDFIFDGENGPYDERARSNPLSYYGRSKLAAENALRALHKDQWAAIRTVLVYGTAEGLNRSNIVLWLIEMLKTGKPVRMVNDQWRNPTYVYDLANGIEKIVRYRKSGIWNLAGREWITVYDFARMIAEALGYDPDLISPTDSTAFVTPAKRPLKSGLLILKAESELGYKPTLIPEAIQDLLKRLASTSN